MNIWFSFVLFEQTNEKIFNKIIDVIRKYVKCFILTFKRIKDANEKQLEQFNECQTLY